MVSLVTKKGYTKYFRFTSSPLPIMAVDNNDYTKYTDSPDKSIEQSSHKASVNLTLL